MPAKYLDHVQGSEEWLAERRKWATASDMAGIMGVKGAFNTRDTILKEKITGVAKEISGFQQNLFDQGHAAEESLRNVAIGHMRMDLVPACYVDEELGILVSLDCINPEQRVLVEAKMSGKAEVLEMARVGKAWEPYRIQVQTQMLVLGYEKGHLFILDKNTGESFLIEMDRDAALQETIKSAAKAFVSDLRAGKLNEVVLEDDRMKRLGTILKQKQEIETELSDTFSTLEMIEKEVDALKKMVASDFTENTITGCGVQITKSKPGTSLDTNKLVAATGMDLTPFMKATAARVSVKLLGAV